MLGRALGDIGNAVSEYGTALFGDVMHGLTSASPPYRCACARALQSLNMPAGQQEEVARRLVDMLHGEGRDAVPWVRETAVLALGRCREARGRAPESAVSQVLRTLREDGDPLVRAAAATALRALPPRPDLVADTLRTLTQAIDDKHPRVMREVVAALGSPWIEMAGPSAVADVLARLLRLLLEPDQTQPLRPLSTSVARLWGLLPEESHGQWFKQLVAGLDAESRAVAINAAMVAEQIAGAGAHSEVTERLVKLLSDPRHALRSAAAGALGRIYQS